MGIECVGYFSSYESRHIFKKSAELWVETPTSCEHWKALWKHVMCLWCRTTTMSTHTHGKRYKLLNQQDQLSLRFPLTICCLVTHFSTCHHILMTPGKRESIKGLRKIYAWKPTWQSVIPTLSYELLVSHYWILLVEYFVLAYRMLLFYRDSLRRTSLKQKWSLLQDWDLIFYKARKVERWLHYQQTTI